MKASTTARWRMSLGRAALVMALVSAASWADGFRNPPEGAANLGRGGASRTYGDDASALVHNPANLVDLKQLEVMPSVTFAYSEVDYHSPFGPSESSDDPWTVLPALFTAVPVQDGRLVVGFGVHVPYGQGREWDRDGLFRFMAPDYVEMKTVNFSPAAALRLSDHVAVGAGLDVMWSELEFRQMFPFMPLPAGLMGPGSRFTFDGEGWGVGAHAGLTVQLGERQRVAVTYRSPLSVEYDGDFDMNPYPGPALFGPPISPSSDFETEVDFPSVVALGYGLRPTGALRLEANVEWVEHSRNEALDIDIANNNVLLLAAQGTTRVPQDWDDTWTFSLGADYDLSPEWVARVGWSFVPTPVPEETLSPALAEEDEHVFAAGLGFHNGAHRADVAYAYTAADDRTIDSPRNPINGDYEFTKHLVMLSYAAAF